MELFGGAAALLLGGVPPVVWGGALSAGGRLGGAPAPLGGGVLVVLPDGALCVMLTALGVAPAFALWPLRLDGGGDWPSVCAPPARVDPAFVETEFAGP